MIRPRLTYANVMSTLALFVALGGGAFAASKFVGRNGAVRLCVSRSGVPKVLKNGQRCGRGKTLVPVNQTGPQGSRGAQGPPGAQGPQGPAGGAGGGASYSAGTGLTLNGTTFGADLSQLQARIGSCASDRLLQSVSQAGTPTCVVNHAYFNQGFSFSTGDTAAVNVPAGAWIVIAGDTIDPNHSDTVTCTIKVNGTTTIGAATQGSPATVPPDANITAMGTTTTTTSSTQLGVTCVPATTSIAASTGATIVAIPVAALN
jgi:hypothetical protein